MDRAPPAPETPRRRGKLLPAIAAGVLLVGGLTWAIGRQLRQPPEDRQQFAHQGILSTVFWVGEPADQSNRYIHNRSSTWTEDWLEAYGGVDDPANRCGLLPCGFTPLENPFYFALPYNDLDQSCNTKPSQRQVPWFAGSTPPGDSIIKNHWIKIRFNDKVAYAQWEDAGPFGEDDSSYVFGQAKPAYWAGLDLSPATAAYLGMQGEGRTDWEFIAEPDVPDGPWRQVVTSSVPDCAA